MSEGAKGETLRHPRRHMQLAFQDPYASMNARMTVSQLMAEPLVGHGCVNGFDDARDVPVRTQVINLLQDLQDEIPDTIDPPAGRRFASRCWLVEQRCHDSEPPLQERTPGHLVACRVR